MVEMDRYNVRTKESAYSFDTEIIRGIVLTLHVKKKNSRYCEKQVSLIVSTAVVDIYTGGISSTH